MTVQRVGKELIQALGVEMPGRFIKGIRVTLSVDQWPTADVSYFEIPEGPDRSGRMTYMQETTTERRFTYTRGEKSRKSVTDMNLAVMRAFLGEEGLGHFADCIDLVIEFGVNEIPRVSSLSYLNLEKFSKDLLQQALCPMTKETPNGDANKPDAPESGFGF